VATKKRKKRSWLKRVLFYIFFPLFVWGAAFLIWLYWSDLTGLFTEGRFKTESSVKIPRKGDKSEALPANRPRENIFDEDRKKLEEILKRRQ
jgi:hypothetical protein